MAAQQVRSSEVWGQAARASVIPKAKAYRGALPEGLPGIEFFTDVAPDLGTPPGRAEWSGARPGVRVEDGWAKISAVITRAVLSTQVEQP